jgi:hypothetical protein
MKKESASGSEMLNKNHRIQLRLTFQHIDSILTEIEHILIDPERDSPFSRYTQDLTPLQRRIVNDYLTRVRTTLTRAMREQAIAFTDPVCGTRWGALTTLLAASISPEDISPDRMRGYGEISLSGQSLLQAIRSEVNLVLANVKTYLEQVKSAFCAARLSTRWRLNSPRGAAPSAAQSRANRYSSRSFERL